MGIFKRRDNQTIAELESYYSGQQRTGMAWIMAFLSLFITVIVLSSIFFGGRWMYRTITNDSGEVATVATDQPLSTTDVDLTVDDTIPGPQLGETSVESGSSQETAIVGGSVSNGGVVSDEAASTSIPNDISDQSTESTGVAGLSTESLPNTGASEVVTVFIFIVVLVAGYALSIRRQLRKNN